MKPQNEKYFDAVTRNMKSFQGRFNLRTPEILSEIAKQTLNSLKMKIGIRANDNLYDAKLTDLLSEAQSKTQAGTKRADKVEKAEKIEKTEKKVKVA